MENTRSSGYGLIGLLFVLLIMAILVVAFFKGGLFEDKEGKKPLERKKEAEETVCEFNRHQIEFQISALRGIPKGINNPSNSKFAEGSEVPSKCPAGGRYHVSGGTVICSIHGPFPNPQQSP